MEQTRDMRIVIAGGGTGGHLFPGIAIAQEFMERNPETQVLFVGTGKPFERSVLAERGFPHKRISSEGIKGRGRWQQGLAIFKIPKGMLESIRVLWRFKPDLVVGVGGYSAGPLAAAAWLLRMNIVLQEQNVMPGITNRMLAPLADRIYVSFQKTAEYFKKDKVRVTGNPIRREILQCAKSAGIKETGQKPFTVLIVGGSQGAHSINLAVMEALERLKEKDRFYFVHPTGEKDEAAVRAGYRRNGIACMVKTFFHDMATQFQKADLIICRAGATTVAEITAMGRAAIFIPFPFAADNHQVLNAQDIETAGAAEMILEKDLTGSHLAERIEYYATHRENLVQMAAAAKAYGRPDAAKHIVDDCYRLMVSG